MPVITDRARGVYHFLGDRAPGNSPIVEPRPVPQNRLRSNGNIAVSEVTVGPDVQASVQHALDLAGPIAEIISSGDRVMVKPNFNSPDPFPASTDIEFLRSVLSLLLDCGARITVGESSGGVWRPTRRVFEQVGLYGLMNEFGIGLTSFEDRADDWVRVRIDGEYLDRLSMPRSAYEADRLVYLPCLKTHRLARMSGALKLTFGFVHPGERRRFHAGHLEQKLAEVNLCWLPDLIIQDGRKAFITGGPDKGDVVEPNLVRVSADPVALDVTGCRVLLSYGGKNRLPDDPWQIPQVKHAVRYSLGAKSDDEYTVISKQSIAA